VSSKTLDKLQIHEYFSRCDKFRKFHLQRWFMLTLTTPYMYTLLDFNASAFDKDNGANGKIPVFRHEFYRISRTV